MNPGIQKKTMFAGLALASWLCGCSQTREADEGSQKSDEAGSRVVRDVNGQSIVTLNADEQSLIRLQATNVATLELKAEIKGYGRVLDAAPLAALVTQLFSAKSASEASEAELKRVKILAATDNASVRALEEAENTAAQSRAQLESVKEQLLATWGNAIAESQDLPEIANSLLALQGALVQIAIPAGQEVVSRPSSARLAAVTEETKQVRAEYIGRLPLIDAQLQGQAFLFLVTSNSLHLVPGTAVSGWVAVSGEPLKGVFIPESAVVRYQEKAWVYVLSEGTNFVRREVILDHPLEAGWFITNGLEPGNEVVVSSVQGLLSEELKSQTPLDD